MDAPIFRSEDFYRVFLEALEGTEALGAGPIRFERVPEEVAVAQAETD